MAYDIYKRGQGKYTRSITFAVGVLISGSVAYYTSEMLGTSRGLLLAYGVPLAIFVTMGLLVFWIVNRPKSADFMIATESEMKKVSWSSRKEVIGGTKVVIVTTMILAMLLYTVDIAFGFFFKFLGVLKTQSGT